MEELKEIMKIVFERNQVYDGTEQVIVRMEKNENSETQSLMYMKKNPKYSKFKKNKPERKIDYLDKWLFRVFKYIFCMLVCHASTHTPNPEKIKRSKSQFGFHFFLEDEFRKVKYEFSTTEETK
ncbi:MAG TPA: hypothetical protein VK175_06290 [Leadbetterella sp.]|nr:hypothetical protein [Leadbetterella sp.]